MTDIKNKEMNNEEQKRYLYSEMTTKEIEEFEEQIFLDDELFSDVVEMENDLIDAYVSGNLTISERKRFEQSLEIFPERREKIANANALQTFIKEEKEIAIPAVASVEATETESITFWQKISALFNVQTLAYGMSALLVLLTVFSVIILLDNRQKDEQIADLEDKANSNQNNNQNNSQEKEKQLQAALAEAKKNQNTLQQRVDKEREATGDLTEELNRQNQNIEQLQKDLAEAKKQNNTNPPDVTKTPQLREPPRVATIELTPRLPNKPDGGIRTTRVGDKTSRVAVNLSLPDATKKDERFSLSLNDKPFQQSVAPRVSADGKKTISLTIETKNLEAGKNKLAVINKDGQEITNYVFEVSKQ